MTLKNKVFVWADPDPIPGNDYTIKSIIFNEDGETALIQYGEGSEAEVYLREIQVTKKNKSHE